MIVSFDELKKHVGGSTVEDVIVRLERGGIKYLRGIRGRPFTTVFALNAAMGLHSTPHSMDDATPDVEIE